MPPDNKDKQLLATCAVLIVVAVIVLGAKSLTRQGSRADLSATPKSSVMATADSGTYPTKASSPTGSPAGSASPMAAPKSPYKDGTFTTRATYGTPDGAQSMGVSITLQQGIVTATSATEQASGHESAQYQMMFIQSYKSHVVGKRIDSLSLSAVSGASLTTKGFNDALSAIRYQAKA